MNMSFKTKQKRSLPLHDRGEPWRDKYYSREIDIFRGIDDIIIYRMNASRAQQTKKAYAETRLWF